MPKAVWEFHVGGYPVCEKWLKDRKGRKLSCDDIQHYQKNIVDGKKLALHWRGEKIMKKCPLGSWARNQMVNIKSIQLEEFK